LQFLLVLVLVLLLDCSGDFEDEDEDEEDGRSNEFRTASKARVPKWRHP
jgi:hypothetical protein